jgi:formiminotetrahydrofolate cyclodeaminase
MSEDFLEALASPQRPIPGGGAASAYGASVGLALLEKIVLLEQGREKIGAEQRAFWMDLHQKVSELRDAFSLLRDKDGESYLQWAEARTSGESTDRLDALLREAVEIPMRIMEEGIKALDCVMEAGKYCRKHLLPDLLVVCELLEAAMRGALHIARANLALAGAASWKAVLSKRLDHLDVQRGGSFNRVRETLL